ncbi:MAG: hypothetical protein BGN92_08575 [Sphingobacteriales bacterium 41-5]|nr:MAG: hypothetical protein BGN92_08575 [Sphingobacteriales bacterium 41-5]
MLAVYPEPVEGSHSSTLLLLSANNVINYFLMNRKQNPEDVLSENKTIRFTKRESEAVQKKADDAGMSFSDFCRQMALNGYVRAVRNSCDMENIRIFINLLLENKTAVSRVGNLIKNRDPNLFGELIKLKNSIQGIVDQIQL